jgi:thiosulfate/3-mercaptopyruvate sulfurtransferase
VSAGFGPLVDTSWLSEHLDHSPLRIVDSRWYLNDPGGGHRAYAVGHIPGAQYIDLDTDLSAAQGPGRHPLPTPEWTAERLGALGIGDRNFVVAYDDLGGGIASRMWWMLRSIGHRRVAVLDGGLQAWEAAGGALDTEPVTLPPAELTVQGSLPSIDREGVADRLGTMTLIDARADSRYTGEIETIDSAAGHIPTAINVPFDSNLAPDGTFLPASELWIRYAGAGIKTADDVVVYCGSGVTACHDILAMEIAGLGTATLYPGSWSDWSASGGAVATGLEPGSA